MMNEPVIIGKATLYNMDCIKAMSDIKSESVQVTYSENGWIKLQPELSREELNKLTKDRWNATF